MINQLQFSIDIDADKQQIWKALWEDKHYRDWCSVFGKGSHFILDSWKKGNKIMFLGPDKNGIFSTIEKHEPFDIIQFKHIGNVVKGKEQPLNDDTKKWSGATETYSIKQGSGFCTLLIEIDVMEEHLEFMSAKLPLALQKIKENSS